MKEPAAGNWVKALSDFVKTHDVPPALITEIDICHDEWCALLVQNKACDCHPTVRFTPEGERWFKNRKR